MIVNTEESHEASYIGNIEENRVGIDKENINFLATLLTSNLYSKPLESFLRETVSNAYDSHVEAGTEEPILLLIEDDDYDKYNYRISIRDYGTGISPERFEKIYRNIGSSTKRDSNDFIGMFGIGRFSCLACTNVANITSYYEGKKYSYVMYNNGNGINIDRLSVTEGDFKNGLEVSIKKRILSDRELVDAIKTLCLFDKLYIEYSGRNYIIISKVKEFNERKVTEYKNFRTCNISSGSCYFSLGKVLYTDNERLISLEFQTRGLIIDLPIGSVDIIPNREALQFNDRTKRVINERFALVKKELQEIVNSTMSKDFTLKDFYLKIVDTNYCKVDSDLSISYSDALLDYTQMKIDNNVIPDKFARFLNEVHYMSIPKTDIYMSRNLGPYEARRLSLRKFITEEIKLFEKADKTFKNITKSYIAETTNSKAVILNFCGSTALKYSITIFCKNANYDYSSCINFLISSLNIESIGNDDVPDSYIDCFRKDKKEKKVLADSIKEMPYRLYTYNTYVNKQGLSLYLKEKGIVVYTYNTREDDMLRHLSEITYNIPCVQALITVKKEEASLLEGNRKFVKLEDFMKRSILKKLATAYIIYTNMTEQGLNLKYYYYANNSGFIPLVQEFREKYKDCLTVISNTTSWFRGLVKDFESKGLVNTQDIEYFKLTDDELKAYKFWNSANNHCREYTQRFVYKKMGKHPRIGLDLKQLPNLNKENNE
jgi:hypothetical protein